MSTSTKFERDLAVVVGRLRGCADAVKIVAEMKRSGGTAEVVNAMLKSAKSGVGPMGGPYPRYSPAYQARVDKAGGHKVFLRGIGRSGREEGMLDPSRFTLEADGNDAMKLVWTAKDPDMFTYAQVHQGSAHGGQTHTKGKVPERPWMHLENRGNIEAFIRAARNAINNMVAKVNAGGNP